MRVARKQLTVMCIYWEHVSKGSTYLTNDAFVGQQLIPQVDVCNMPYALK